MPWTVEYDPQTAWVVVTGFGQNSDEDARAQTVEVVNYLRQNQSNGVLVDYSEAQSELSLPSLYWLPDYSAELGAPWNIQVAVILPRTGYRLETYHFFELVCQNAGHNVKLFDTRPAAEDWLAPGRPVLDHADHPDHT